MAHDIIPFRTYATAAILSLLLNVGAVGTFATFQFADSTRSGGTINTASAVAPLVLNDLPPTLKPTDPRPTTDQPPKAEPEPPAPESKPEPQPTPPAPPPPEDPSVKVGNPDAPDSKTSVWVGVSKDAGSVKGARGAVDQAEFKPGLAGMPSDQAASNPSPPTVSPPSSIDPASQPKKELEPNQSTLTPSPAAEMHATSEPVPPQDLDPPRPASGKDTIGAVIPDLPDRIDAAKAADAAAPATPTTDDLFAATLDSARDATRLARRMIEMIAKASQLAPAETATATNTPTPESPRSEQTPAPQAESPKPTSAATPAATTGQNGNGADRESDAFSKTTPVDVRLGQPLAGKGLFIKTVAPRWTTATRVFYRPRNAFVRVKFGRDGRVIRAAYIDGQDAGAPDVSGPLLDAVYRWTAKGQELSTIPPDQPQTGVVITFHIIWTD